MHKQEEQSRKDSVAIKQGPGSSSRDISSAQLSSVVQSSCSVMSDSLQPHGLQASLSITNSRSFYRQTHLVYDFYRKDLCQRIQLLGAHEC